MGFLFYLRYFWGIPDESFWKNIEKSATIAFLVQLFALQEELAQKVGIRRETIGNLENGRYNPSLVLAWNIAKQFQVSIEEMFTVENDLS